MPIKILVGDITSLQVDAVVNAANGTLLGGGGVDGAIHRVAGPDLKAYSANLGRCTTGSAVITPGFNLPAKYIIHTVGPIFGEHDEAEDLLRQCYLSSLEIAAHVSHNITSIAFPAISTGAFGFPKDLAAKISIEVITGWLNDHPDKEVILVFLDHKDTTYHKQLIET